MSEEPFEIIFEATIRYVRPKNSEVDPINVVLFALSVSDDGIKIYRYLRDNRIATPEEIANKLNMELTKVQDELDYLYSIGLVDKLGKAYICDMPLSYAIKRRTSRRVTDILNYLADLLEKHGGGDE